MRNGKWKIAEWPDGVATGLNAAGLKAPAVIMSPEEREGVKSADLIVRCEAYCIIENRSQRISLRIRNSETSAFVPQLRDCGVTGGVRKRGCRNLLASRIVHD